jgi:Spy/CpxP family protein refolding chaperone
MSGFGTATLWRVAVVALAIGMAGAAQAQPGERGQRGQRGGGFDPEQFFQRLDANGDGVLDATEFRGGEEAFKRMDANSDGKVTLEEFRSGMAAAREEWGRGDRGPRGPQEAGPRGLMQRNWQEELGLGDDEWTVVKPRFDKVMSLRAPLAEAGALRETLANENATAEDIKARVDALRKARAKQQEELKAAREALRELLTPRQEALLVLEGIMD